MLGDYSKRPRLVYRDDLPRYTYFNLSLANYTDSTSSAAPPVLKLSMPYQVLPNGRIIASQLLRIELNWSPWAVTDSALAVARTITLRRMVVDAIQSPPVVGGIAVAGNVSSDTSFINYPMSVPSVVKVFDRVASSVGGGTTSTGANSEVSFNEDYDFGCCGSYPIIPSGTLHLWGFWMSNDGAASASTSYVKSTFNQSSGFGSVYNQAYNLPKPVGFYSDNTTNPQPFVQGRIWFRTVELTPYQHLMIVQKYTNKLPMSSDESYDPRANPSLNPQRDDNSNITPWFGS